MNIVERFINYAKIWTTSDEENEAETPSTARQFELAHFLEREMKALGLEDVRADEHGYVYGYVPAAEGCKSAKTVGFIAHLDTAPEFNGADVHPVIHENYDGEDLYLGEGRWLRNSQFPHLKALAGRTLITADGSSLLGADDKAGIAVAVSLAEDLLSSDMPHGRVALCFCPDEEIGHGAALLDIGDFGADFAYTLDGGPENELAYENFNACSAVFSVKGFNIHPGDAKDKMINASLVAMEINSLLPAGEIPAKTEGYEGFFHLCDMKGTVEEAGLTYIVRDHDREHLRVRKEMLRHIEKTLNEKYGEGTVTLTLRDQYLNMAEYLKDKMYVVELAKTAIEEAGMVPEVLPIRGGTDGAQLTTRGLPCPNLGAGGYAFHGPYEHITAEGMEAALRVAKNIVRKTAEL